MRQWMEFPLVGLMGIGILSDCSSTQVAQLSTSLGIAAALFVDQELRDLNLTGEYKYRPCYRWAG